MKKLLLLSAAAMLTAGSAIAQVTEPTLTKVWEVQEDQLPAVDPTSTSIGASAAPYATGFDGTIYVYDKSAKTIYAYTKDKVKQEYAKNETAFTGTSITCDDAGNLLLSQGIYSSSATTWNIVSAEDQSVKNFVVTFPSEMSGGNIYNVGRVVGDMLSKEGAYVWIARTGMANVACVKIAEGAFVSATASTAMKSGENAMSFSSVTFAQPSKETVAEIEAAEKPADCFYLRDRSNKNFYYVDADGNTKYFAAPTQAYMTDGGDIFTLSGVKYAIYPSGNGNKAHGSAFTIVDLDDNVNVVAEETESTETNNYYQSLVSEKVSETKANIYQYYGGKKAAMYTFEVPAAEEDDTTAIESVVADNAAVEYYNLQGVKVANPQNGLFIKKQGNKAVKVVL